MLHRPSEMRVYLHGVRERETIRVGDIWAPFGGRKRHQIFRKRIFKTKCDTWKRIRAYLPTRVPFTSGARTILKNVEYAMHML